MIINTIKGMAVSFHHQYLSGSTTYQTYVVLSPAIPYWHRRIRDTSSQGHLRQCSYNAYNNNPICELTNSIIIMI